MGLLENILGGNSGQQAQGQTQGLEGFVNRYMQGAPSEGYSDQEVLQQYNQVAPHLSQGDYMQAAQQAFERMSPQERSQFGQFVMQQSQSMGYSLPMGNQANMQDPGVLAQLAGHLHAQQPGLLSQVLSSFTGGSAMGGMAGMGNMGGMGTMSGAGAGGGILSSPAAKSALAGIAAMALKNAMNRR